MVMSKKARMWPTVFAAILLLSEPSAVANSVTEAKSISTIQPAEANGRTGVVLAGMVAALAAWLLLRRGARDGE
jgi:NAD(P)H-hydrate repair Nnr-like enzyme with NAD(P)H-hydrate dehydratase domain